MKKLAATLIMGSFLALAACGGGASTGGPPTITMGASTFEGNTNLSISKGTVVTFNDPSGSGGPHKLATGTNGAYTPEAGAPTDFESATGLNFTPGTKVTETFNTPGVYKITCTVHPAMEATITVK
jgi:plastocyanin